MAHYTSEFRRKCRRRMGITLTSFGLGQNLVDQLAVNIGQPEVATRVPESEFLVVDAHKRKFTISVFGQCDCTHPCAETQ